MNNKIYLYVLILFALGLLLKDAHGQDIPEKEVPSVVINSFKATYPNMFVYEWEWKKKEKLYEAEFKNKGIKYKAYFLPEGQWKRTKWEVEENELPEPIHQEIKRSEYAQWKIDDVEIHKTPEYDQLYKVELKKSKNKVNLYYFPDGKLWKREPKK